MTPEAGTDPFLRHYRAPLPTGHEVSGVQGLPMCGTSGLFSLATEELFLTHMVIPLTETWKVPLKEVICGVALPLCSPAV